MNHQEYGLICYTIGHSIHPLNKFLKFLSAYNINCVIDIRDNPSLLYAKQYNVDYLKKELNEKNIEHLYLGDCLGARHDGPDNKIIETDRFKSGIGKIIGEIKKGTVPVIMCSEKEPFNCHRFTLVARALSIQQVTVKHLLKDGSIRLNSELEKRLLQQYRPEYGNNDGDISKALNEAYEEHSRQIVCCDN